ncbi:NAD-dependent epimerase/dehydratase family protein [Aquimarina muelleri]|uniref:NAD-dependent epimerase n=1 Tax=Aquimarina muelleri TaxID=279356 RepID=A0A918JSJ1_9FLAO|nr:NAD-dependent epimerase/dehydratase family protein [Aquimarina muelleri]MCX2761583.1 GDP-mannose 4,6-dehydratase [Aquimarina muelleri]GGX07745.1 NAD-dependent epimerase [Aquimarina muelleri]
MKILVTGAAGFIGFHTVKKLLLLGHEVLGFDNINNYYDTSLKYDRLDEVGITRKKVIDNEYVNSSTHKAFRFIKMDLTQKAAIMDLFRYERFDTVIHLAAQAGVRYSIENPDAYIKSNIDGFFNILEACRHYPVKHLTYASSSSVYGNNKTIPFSVEHNVDKPISLYAATKKSNELMAHTYSHLFKIPTTGLRFFTVYGPWGRPDMAPSLFTDAIINNKPLHIFNNGDMQRDFTYIDDIVEGILKVNKNPPKPKSPEIAPYLLHNIGNSNPVKLMDFINCIEKNAGAVAKKIFLPMQPGDVSKTYADISSIATAVGYTPKTNIETGVKHFVNWYISYKIKNKNEIKEII